jgi:hypothetical protein
MANEQMTQKIVAALGKLDPANDDHWTPDGLPKVGVVQKLASDQTIKLRDIQEAAPGFERTAQVQAPGATDDFGDPVEQIGAEATGAAADAAQPTNDAEGDDFISDDEMHEILVQRVVDYDTARKAARAKQAEGAKEEVEALKALNAAKAELNAKFPPLTAAENIKQYLASEQAKRAAAHGHGNARVDAAMARGNARGWRRPVRAVAGADGNLIKGADGQVVMPRSMQVRPRAVVPSMGGGR